MISFLRTLPGGPFILENLLLAVQAPAISAKTLILAHNTMAWNNQCDGVLSTRTPHGSHRPWIPKSLCDIAVRPGFTTRNRSQHLPHLALKRCRPDVERETRMGHLIFYQP